MNTNEIQLAQTIAAAHGFNLTGYEFAALCALPTSIAAHFWAFVKFYAHIGGLDGIKRFIKTGDNKPNKPLSAAPETKPTPAPGSDAAPGAVEK